MSSQKQHLRRNQSGFSLAAVMAIAAVVGLIAVLVISVVTHMYRGGHHQVENTAVSTLIQTVTSVLGNSNFCDSALHLQASYTSDPTNPPVGAGPLRFTKPPAIGNPTANVEITSISLNTTTIAWRGMSLVNYGAPNVFIDHINLSTTAGGTDLGSSSPTIPYLMTYISPSGSSTFMDAWPGYINIWFTSSDGAGMKVRSIPLTAMTPRPWPWPGIGQLVTLSVCSTADAAAQICWELGGSLDPGQNYKCTHTALQRITGTSNTTWNCGPGLVTTGWDGCTGSGLNITNYNGTGSASNPTQYGCAPVYQFIGFDSTTGTPICTCQAFCY